jgi:GNAT superfamily N-acetyltransferase
VPADVIIRPITADETIALRLPILRAGMKREDAVFEGDGNPDTRHFGAFVEGSLVGVVTVFPAPMPGDPGKAGTWQLRGMATAPEVRGAGCGARLLEACYKHVLQCAGELIWCNARVPAQGFYAKHGWTPSGEVFVIPTAGPHIRMYIPVEGRQS